MDDVRIVHLIYGIALLLLMGDVYLLRRRLRRLETWAIEFAQNSLIIDKAHTGFIGRIIDLIKGKSPSDSPSESGSTSTTTPTPPDKLPN